MFIYGALLDTIQGDPDRQFAYNTRQQVAIRDMFLGLIEKSVQFTVVVYVFFGVLLYFEGYLEFEHAQGALAVQLSGSAVATSTGKMRSHYFSAEELTYPYIENQNVFVATRIDVAEQKRCVSEDPAFPCLTDADCSKDIGAACSENKLCVEPTWCTPGETQAIEAYKLDGVQHLRMWMKSTISFPQLDKNVKFTSKMDAPVMYPRPGFNTVTVKDLLLLCEPPVRFEEISELGAAIEVQLHWPCQLDRAKLFGCTPEVRTRRIDSILDPENIGFGYQRIVGDLGPDARLLEKRRGIRFYFSSTGHGSQFSFSIVIFKISTGMALLNFAPVITDIMMLKVFKLKQKYYARKYDVTEDFSKAAELIEKMTDQERINSDQAARDAAEAEAESEKDLADERWRREMNDEYD